jgi:hypothetical protein
MYSLILKEKLLKSSKTDYISLLIAKILPLLLALQIASCNTELDGSKQKIDLIMEINPTSIVGENATINVIFNLAENSSNAILDQYQLKVTLSDSGNNVLYKRIGELESSTLNSVKKLSSLARQTTLSIEDEFLIIPLTLIPSSATNSVRISFELLNEHGRLLQVGNVTWTRTTNTISMPLIQENNELKNDEYIF